MNYDINHNFLFRGLSKQINSEIKKPVLKQMLQDGLR